MSKEEIEIIEEFIKNNDKISVTKLANKLNKTRYIVYSYLKSNNIQYTTVVSNVNNIPNDIVVSLYQDGQTMGQLSELYNCSPNAIKRILLKHNITLKESKPYYKYNFNHNFFENIDTEEKAYFLGLMYADGNVSQKTNGVNIYLKDTDKKILEHFIKALNADFPLRYRHQKDRRMGFENVSPQYYIDLNSVKMKEDLINKGCVPAKSKILTFPTEEQVPSYLHSHFIRGYFDGDGCIYVNKHLKCTRLSFIGSTLFIEKLNMIVNDNLNLGLKLLKTDYDSVSTIGYGKLSDVKTLISYMYRDSKVYLDRKYEKCNLILEKCVNLNKKF